METDDDLNEATERGTAWGLRVVKASGLTGKAGRAGEDPLDALGRIVIQLAAAVTDLSLERGEAFAQAFEVAARKEIARHLPRLRPDLH